MSTNDEYMNWRASLEALAPLVSQHGGGKEFAALVDLVDSLKPEETPEPVLPEVLKGQRARNALMVLRMRFRDAVGINVFDTKTEAVAASVWGLVHAIVADRVQELTDEYTNSGMDLTPDWDEADEILRRVEIPENLGQLLWNVRPRKGK